jgi:hypothetical protein
VVSSFSLAARRNDGFTQGLAGVRWVAQFSCALRPLLTLLKLFFSAFLLRNLRASAAVGNSNTQCFTLDALKMRAGKLRTPAFPCETLRETVVSISSDDVD